MTDQEKLDKSALLLMRQIKDAEDGAMRYCAKGDADTAAKLHRIAAHMRMAYAEGRTIKAQDGIQPRFGGDGKG